MKKQLITGTIALGAVLMMSGCGASSDSSSSDTIVPATKSVSMSHEGAFDGGYQTAELVNVSISTDFARTEIHLHATLDISQENYTLAGDIPEEMYDTAQGASAILTCAATDSVASVNNIPVCEDITQLACENYYIFGDTSYTVQMTCWPDGYSHHSATVSFELEDGSGEVKTFIPVIVGYDDATYTSQSAASVGRFTYNNAGN